MNEVTKRVLGLLVVVLLLQASPIWAGSGTSNGGHGYEINGKTYSYDLTLNGIQFVPYDSLDYTPRRINDLERLHVREALRALVTAKDLDEEGELVNILDDPEEFYEILFRKLAQISDLVSEHGIRLDVSRMIYDIGKYRWRYLNVECPVIVDADDPKDRENDELLGGRYREFFPKKLQLAFREKREISFCQRFKDMEGVVQQVALVLHEIIYAYMDSHFRFVRNDDSNYEVRRHVYSLVGLFFDEQFRSPNSTYLRHLLAEVNDLNEKLRTSMDYIEVETLVQLNEEVVTSIRPHEDGRLCTEGSMFWTIGERGECDDVQPAHRYRLCAGREGRDEGRGIQVWANRFAADCELTGFAYGRVNRFSLDGEYLKAEEKTLGSYRSETVVELCSGVFKETCDISFFERKTVELDERFGFRAAGDQENLQVDRILDIVPEVEEYLLESLPEGRQACAAISRAKVIVYTIDESEHCETGSHWMDPLNVLKLSMSSENDRGIHLWVAYDEPNFNSYATREVYTTEPLTYEGVDWAQIDGREGNRGTPPPFRPTVRNVDVIKRHVGYYDPDSNELRNLCTGNWTGLCEIRYNQGSRVDLVSLDVVATGVFAAAEAGPAFLAAKRVKFLVERDGIDPNARDEYGSTLLLHAVRGKTLDRVRDEGTELVRYLLEELSVDVNMTDSQGYAAMDYVVSRRVSRDEEIASILENFGARPTNKPPIWERDRWRVRWLTNRTAGGTVPRSTIRHSYWINY